jgi:hypothetical protein
MKLLARHYSAIISFLTFANRYSSYPSVTDVVNGMDNIRYFKFDSDDFVPQGADDVGKGIYRQMFSRDASVCRSTSTLIRNLFSGIGVIDSANVRYLAGPGMIADANGVPLLIALKPTQTYKNRTGYKHEVRLVVNSYVFRRENSFSKFIIDTLYPSLTDPSYRRSMFEDDNDYNVNWRKRSLPKVEIVFMDIDENFWINKPLDIVLDKEKISTFTSDFCANFVTRSR